jgi:dTDP-4-dehydrorhamnose 3,5-epimerase
VEHGIHVQWVQHSVSYNRRAGTLRGLHYQTDPHSETKLVRCTRGIVYDVIADLRSESPTFGRWYGVVLTPDNGRMLYVPEGFAHGFQTLADHSEVTYQISEFYYPELQRGVRWDDPTLAIAWPPCGERILSQRDRSFPDLQTCLASC